MVTFLTLISHIFYDVQERVGIRLAVQLTMRNVGVSVLTYAIEVIDVADRDERQTLRVAFNSIFRRVFGYRQWESVTNLQHSLKRHRWKGLHEINAIQNGRWMIK